MLENKRFSKISPILLLLTALAIFFLTYFSRVTYNGSDAQFSLLVSQSIIEHGTIKLDAYADLSHVSGKTTNVLEWNDHLYYYFPLGTSLIALPAVWVATRFGFDLSRAADDFLLQSFLSAVTCVLLFLVLFFLARTVLNELNSFLVATITVLGSSFVSTLGTALWNLNLATLFVLLSLLILVRLERGRWRSWPYAYLLGVFLFAAFISRPTAASFIALTLLFLLIRHRSWFVRTAPTALLLLSGWLLFNLLEYGQLLAPYYALARLDTSDASILTALYGQLFSPSRGIFIFSPFFLVVAAGIALDFKAYRHRPLLFFASGWFVLHTLLVSLSSSVPWWGGHSFGARFMTDALPALFWLSVLLFERLSAGGYARGTRIALIALYLLFGGVGIAINSVQGLYNRNTARWNGALLVPDPGLHNEYLFDWRYPQFAASIDSLCARHREFMAPRTAAADERLDVYRLNEPLAPDADPREALFVGWSIPWQQWRWSECAELDIFFGAVPGRGEETLLLNVAISSQTAQTIDVSLNGAALGQIDIREPGTEPRLFLLPVDGAMVAERSHNRLTFDVPAVDVVRADPHVQGIRFFELVLLSAEQP